MNTTLTHLPTNPILKGVLINIPFFLQNFFLMKISIFPSTIFNLLHPFCQYKTVIGKELGSLPRVESKIKKKHFSWKNTQTLFTNFAYSHLLKTPTIQCAFPGKVLCVSSFKERKGVCLILNHKEPIYAEINFLTLLLFCISSPLLWRYSLKKNWQ